MLKNHFKNKGFTLLEIMISVAIISLVLVTLLTTQNQSLDFLYTSLKISKATLLAKELLEEIEIEKFPELTNESGFFEEEDADMKWVKIVSETLLENLRRIDVEVSWRNGARERSVKLISYVAER